MLVDAKSLLAALEDKISSSPVYLDSKTGEIFHGSCTGGNDDFSSGRYILIEPLPSSATHWHIMNDFVDGLSLGEPRTALSVAVKARRPFRCFADALERHLSVHQAWQVYLHQERLQIARVWLENHDVEADLK